MRAKAIFSSMHVPALGAALLAATLAPSAMAASPPDTRLVSCGEGSCLIVSGRRDDAASEVRINGRTVQVSGRQSWKVSLPVGTVRAWSVPMARSIDVTVVDTASGHKTTDRADLPIGLLGHATELASLTIGVP